MKIPTLVLLYFLFSTVALASTPPAAPEELLKESQQVNWGKAISRSVIIKAPIDKVWRYASDSTQAVNWSVYFDHISPLPGNPDGQIGSLRRCFRNKDESGEAWDEVTINTIPERMRQIVTYNFINYPFRWVHEDEYIFVRQLYRPIDNETTQMVFQTITRPDANFLFKMIFQWAEAETGEIFQLNLENIRAAIEGHPRVYSWR